MDPVIEITIGPDGAVKVAGEGFKGASCEEATRALEAALGMTVDSVRTTEFYEQEMEKETQW